MRRTRNNIRYEYTKEQEETIREAITHLHLTEDDIANLLDAVPVRRKRELLLFAAKMAISRAIEYLHNKKGGDK